MECSEAREKLRRGRREECEQHLADCEACAELAEDSTLLAALDAFRPEVGEGVELDRASSRQRLDRELEKEQRASRWLRNRSTAARTFAILLACTFGIVAVLILRPRVDLSVYPFERMLALLSALALLLYANLWASYRPLHRPPLSRWVATVFTLLAVLVTWLPALSAPAHRAHPASLEGAGDDFSVRAMLCLTWGLAVSLPLFGAVWLGMRGNNRLSELPASVWVTAGLFGVLALQLHCPIVHPEHLIAGHSTVVLTVVFLAVAASWWRWHNRK